MNPEEVSLMEAAAAIRDGVLSPVEYVNSLFARIDQVDSRVQAWVTVDRDEVLAEARRSEAEAQKKQFRGPLHGIPVGIKDIFYTRNLRTTMGSMLFENFIPGYDARAVTRLKEAGAISIPGRHGIRGTSRTRRGGPAAVPRQPWRHACVLARSAARLWDRLEGPPHSMASCHWCRHVKGSALPAFSRSRGR